MDPQKPATKPASAPVDTTEPLEAGSASPAPAPAPAPVPAPETASTSDQPQNDATPAAPAPTILGKAERAFQYSLSRENLEQEVGQVMGTLNSWWGGVKKQSASTITNLRADLDKTVAQAQADFEQLRTAKVEVVRKDPAEFEAEEAKRAAESEPLLPAHLMDRITSSTSQIQQQLQSSLQSTLKAAQANPTLANAAEMRNQLIDKIQSSSAKKNIQMSVQQAEKLAEEYLKKGEQFRKDAEKWMGDAVTVVPPGNAGSGGVSWDGNDWYSFSTEPVSTEPKVLFDADTPRQSLSRNIPASRKDVMLSRLREDKELLSLDPATIIEQRVAFETYLRDVWPSQKDDKEEALVGEMRMSLVPEHMTDEEFWQRYMFQKHLIVAEEERRQKLLQASAENEAYDFSWDDDAEDTSPPPAVTDDRSKTPTQPPREPAPASTTAAAAPTATALTPTTGSAAKPAAAAASAPTPAASTTAISKDNSPRESEESYDVVSDQGKAQPIKKAEPSSTSVDDEDSDWE